MHWLPEGVSTYSPSIDTMFYVILAVTGTAFVLTEGLLFYFALRYRARQGIRATYTHGNSRLEVIWTIVPAVMLVILGLSSRRVWVEATKTGTYEIACAELCGFGHGTMRGQLTVLEPDEFQKWLKEQEANVVPAEAPPA